MYDLFISHASEDRAEFIEPLVVALKDRGLRVWYDRRKIRLGDDFRRMMDEGLASSRFGVVVVSPNFRKYWPEAELSALFNRERTLDEKHILPVVHALTPREVATTWPLLAARAAAYSSEGVDAVADKIYSATRQIQPSPARGASRLHGVPRTRSVQFVGRERELAELSKLLEQVGSVRIAASVEGLAGIGKTELALQLVHRLAERGTFPGGIFWFDAAKPDLTATWGTVIADTLGIPSGPAVERAALAVRTVSRRAGSVLLVLDNVEEWGTGDRHPEPLPEGSHLRYLLTTRQRSLGGARFQHLSVGFLEPKSARRLLASLTGRDLDAMPGSKALLKHLGGHALALEIAGAFLSEYPEETPESYLAALASDPEVEGEVSALVRYERTVSQAFTTIWDRLEEDTRGAWRLAACFEPELASPGLADAVGLSAKHRRSLRRLHLIESDPEGRWRMHRLTRQFGRRAGTEQESAKAREAFVLGCAKFSDPIEPSDGFRLYFPDRSHLDAALKLAPEVFAKKASRLAHFQGRIGIALKSAGELSAACHLLDQALKSGLESLGESHLEVGILRSSLGLVLQDQGDLPAARQLLEQTLESGLESLKKDHPEVAIRRSNLAGVLKDLGELGTARELLEQALASDLANLGEDHPVVAMTRSNLATVLRDLGELDAARDLLELALTSTLTNLGEDHPAVATSRTNLAGVLKELGELDTARDLLELALASTQANLGENHPAVATSRSNLATVLRDLGELDKARDMLELALASTLANLGEDHPAVATRRFKLAIIYESDGELDSARDLLERVLEAQRESLGESHPSRALTRVRFARVLSQLGETRRARTEAQAALETVVRQPEGSLLRRQVEQLAKELL